MRKAAIEIRLTRDEAKALSWVASTAIKLIDEDPEPSKCERIINSAVKRARNMAPPAMNSYDSACASSLLLGSEKR